MPPQIVSTDMSVHAGIALYTVTLPVILSTLTNAVQYTLTPGHKGRLLAMDFYTHTPASAASKLATLTPSIGGVDVTGGVIALTTAGSDARGEKTAGSPITANNAFLSTETITITGSAVTAFTEGSGHLALQLVNDDTLNGIAGSLNGQRAPNPY